MLNINGSTDPNYRYKMPKVVGKVEGRGNGIKTVIVNCPELCRSLKRSPEQLTKFVGLQMGANSRIEHEKSIVNGAIDTSELQKMVQLFIEKFVLCPNCGNPETVQKLSSSGGKGKSVVVLKCKACGKTSEADNTHRLISLIVKELSEMQKGEKQEEEELAGKKEDAKKSASSSTTASAPDKKKKKKKKKKADPEVVLSVANKVVESCKAGEEDQIVLERTLGWIQENSLLPGRDLLPILWKALVTLQSDKTAAAVEKHASLFKLGVKHTSKGQARLIKACVKAQEELKSVPLALKALYDCEVCSDVEIVKWYRKAEKKMDSALITFCAPLISWLEESDDEDDSDDDGEEESQEQAQKQSQKKKYSSSESSEEEEEE